MHLYSSSLYHLILQSGRFRNFRADIRFQQAFSTQQRTPGSSSSIAQWYGFLPSLQNLSDYIAQSCSQSDQKCISAASSLLSADYIDVDYEKDIKYVTFTSFWANGPHQGSWGETIDYSGHERVEVGLLHPETSEDKDEIKMGGWLTVVGYDKTPSTPMPSFTPS